MADLTGMLQAAAGSGGGGGPWELTNATFNGTPFNRFSTSAQDSDPLDVFFKPDGTKMYVVGDQNNSVYEYDLPVEWNIKNASYVRSFSVASQDTNPAGLFFKPDGTKMYVSGFSSDSIHEYDLSTAWNISTASFSQSLSVSAQDTTPRGIFFKPDGTKMYMAGQGGDNINEYSLSSAWDISTASYVQNFSIASQDPSPKGLFFKADGTKMYFVGDTNDNVFEYSLSSAWDVSTASYVQSFFVGSEGQEANGLFFKDDGTKMYISNGILDTVYSYDLSSAWDISTASYSFPPTTDYFSVATEETNPRGIFFKPDGTRMYICGTTGDDVNQYSLSTAWDVTSASYVTAFSVSAQETSPTSVFFKDDGTKMYILGSSGDDVNEYSLSSAWNVTSSSYVQSFSVASQDTAPNSLFFKPDGTKMYMVGNANLNANEYDLSTPWDISTASYVQSFSLASQDASSTQGVFFKDDGTKMYVSGADKDEIYEYNLSTAWNISTASYVQSFFVGSQEATPRCIFFKDDGTKLYITGTNSDSVWSFDL